VSINPDDSYSLLVLGQVQFRKEQYEPAMDSLSKAARLDPANAEIQNFLGLTLSQRGMRQEAETAFRKAIQIAPDYAAAHYNLAVFYLTQKPAWPELARWHYRKALNAGFSRNLEFEKMMEQPRAEGSSPKP
jgi:tetratricopeptide (TPR) repeat protein